MEVCDSDDIATQYGHLKKFTIFFCPKVEKERFDTQTSII
jgi:hypothetical protein